MPTKLKKPITITITHVENAVALYLKMLKALDLENSRNANIWNHVTSEVGEQLLDGFKANSIDQDKWEPPQPLYIAGCEADFKNNGDVKLGSETLDRATLVEVKKRSDEAMKGESEWPKFWHNVPARSVYRADSEHCYGFSSTLSGWEECAKGSAMVEFAERRADIYKPIPRAEASAILGRDV